MQNSPIQIGSIDLQDFEIPPSIRFGGRHRVAVHTLGGGRRIVERLGPDESEIRFQGIFSGPYAEARSRALDNLRRSGEIVWLTWESFRHQVIVSNFVADYHSPWWISYQVSCIITEQVQIAWGGSVGVAVILSGDLTNAVAAAVGSTISLEELQRNVTTGNALTANTTDQARARATVRSTAAVIDEQMEQQSTALVMPIPPEASLADKGGLYISRVEYAASLAATMNVKSYVGRIGVTLERSGS